jgi:uncharacterized damage-inducible protein DinB
MRHVVRRGVLSLALVIGIGVPAFAQTPSAAPPPSLESMAGGLAQLYRSIKANVLEAAELMPEEHFAFKPAPDVRSFGELVGHVTNTHYNFCSAARGVPSTAKINHETLKTKAELVAALKASVEFCDAAYTNLTDAQVMEPAKFGQAPITRGYALTYNIAHDNEHYGNMVTYLRLKGLVPPSTARAKR